MLPPHITTRDAVWSKERVGTFYEAELGCRCDLAKGRPGEIAAPSRAVGQVKYCADSQSAMLGTSRNHFRISFVIDPSYRQAYGPLASSGLGFCHQARPQRLSR